MSSPIFKGVQFENQNEKPTFKGVQFEYIDVPYAGYNEKILKYNNKIPNSNNKILVTRVYYYAED